MDSCDDVTPQGLLFTTMRHINFTMKQRRVATLSAFNGFFVVFVPFGDVPSEIDIRIHIFDYIRIYSNIDIRIRIRL